ncbi:thiamine pyrophosphate-dependent dehydrogenase E1 component subunit alpha [Variovorax sp. WS11]|nr:thiamine pyrophosphate-dependent dehydrogenase E1 component subunit alpha [Variovorax sp. WS11]
MSSLSSAQMKKLHANLTRAMAYDRLFLRLLQAGKLVGFYHEGGIALAPGVAAGSFLTQQDVLWPHYRGHGVGHLLSKEIDVQPYVAEHMGREAGCCKGRSTYHWSFPQQHVFGFTGNLGAGFGLSVGWGYAALHKKSGQIVMCCSGDGAFTNGRSHEGLLLAAQHRLPVVFWCENNGMVQHSSSDDLHPMANIADLATTFGIPSRIVDGQDLFACGEAALAALAHVRAGNGPILVECKVLRAGSHSVGSVNNEGVRARSPQLMKEWRDTRDPLVLARAQLLADGVMTESEIEDVHAAAEDEVMRAEAFADSSPRATPSVEEMQSAVYAD